MLCAKRFWIDLMRTSQRDEQLLSVGPENVRQAVAIAKK